MGATTISELEMERGIEDFEKQSWEKINIALRNNEVQEDQDDSVICDVCRSSYCHNHSLNPKRKDLDDFDEEIGKRKQLTPEERSLPSRQKILKIESEFFKHVDLSQASLKLGLEMDVVDLLFRFWILKRRSQANLIRNNFWLYGKTDRGFRMKKIYVGSHRGFNLLKKTY